MLGMVSLWLLLLQNFYKPLLLIAQITVVNSNSIKFVKFKSDPIDVSRGHIAHRLQLFLELFGERLPV